MSPLALPPRHVERPPALVCWLSWTDLRQLDHEVTTAAHRARIAIPSITSRPVEIPLPLACLLERRPFTVHHWRPHMPHAHKDQRRVASGYHRP